MVPLKLPWQKLKSEYPNECMFILTWVLRISFVFFFIKGFSFCKTLYQRVSKNRVLEKFQKVVIFFFVKKSKMHFLPKKMLTVFQHKMFFIHSDLPSMIHKLPDL